MALERALPVSFCKETGHFLLMVATQEASGDVRGGVDVDSKLWCPPAPVALNGI